jgi:hypothetical protein
VVRRALTSKLCETSRKALSLNATQLNREKEKRRFRHLIGKRENAEHRTSDYVETPDSRQGTTDAVASQHQSRIPSPPESFVREQARIEAYEQLVESMKNSSSIEHQTAYPQRHNTR